MPFLVSVPVVGECACGCGVPVRTLADAQHTQQGARAGGWNAGFGRAAVGRGCRASLRSPCRQVTLLALRGWSPQVWVARNGCYFGWLGAGGVRAQAWRPSALAVVLVEFAREPLVGAGTCGWASTRGAFTNHRCSARQTWGIGRGYWLEVTIRYQRGVSPACSLTIAAHLAWWDRAPE